ncbi:hypothetical protein [Streptomyces ossamyceticus]|uniref:hypothetical protein n=1 Tax=Streptomyces ossamyceticus TaxID=249581 RepID=UPI003442B4DF
MMRQDAPLPRLTAGAYMLRHDTATQHRFKHLVRGDRLLAMRDLPELIRHQVEFNRQFSAQHAVALPRLATATRRPKSKAGKAARSSGRKR